MSDGGGQSIPCSNPGATEACCDTGTRTCGGGEFPTWGPCLSSSGESLSCCMPGEFGSCDGGQPALDMTQPLPMLCTCARSGCANNEPDILVGYSPATGQTVDGSGQIKVWVKDEAAPFIAPGEVVDPNTGAITTPGDRTAKAPDGYLWEPALYIAPASAESGGTPNFPTAIKGWYRAYGSSAVDVNGMDPPPGPQPMTPDLGRPYGDYTGEDIWDVKSLGLGPGSYVAEFVIHDGDTDRGVGCVTIVIQ
jgi:hypothetical protein